MKNPTYTKELRRELRRKQTPAEDHLWKILRAKRFHQIKFRRQYGIGPYILDFYAPSLRLAIEVDGEIHNSRERKLKDMNRTQYLNDNGKTVLRFTNHEVLKNTNEVLKRTKYQTDKSNK